MRPVNKKLHIVAIFASAILFLNLGTGSSQKTSSGYTGQFSINLKTKALVIGPIVTLGDIGSIVIADSIKRRQVSELKIADAAPPGESTEISLSYVKKRLQAAGLEDVISFLRGPSIIRVTTAQEEIDKAFVREEYAQFASPKADVGGPFHGLMLAAGKESLTLKCLEFLDLFT